MSDFAAELSTTLRVEQDALAHAVVEHHYAQVPELAERYGEAGRKYCLEDAYHHLRHLAQAAASRRERFFVDYVEWARVVLASRGVPASDLDRNLEALDRVLRDRLDPELAELAGGWIAGARRALEDADGEPPSHIGADDELGRLARSYLDALLKGLRGAATDLILGAVERGVSVRDVYLRVFQPSQRELGRLWQLGKITVAQEHYATAATQLNMSLLYPRLFAGERRGRTMIACCVGGEMHEIGMRMVADLFELDGWDTHFLGANTPAAGVVTMARERDADLLAVSATLVPHVREVAGLLSEVRREPRLAELRVMVGGYPFNLEPELWRELGADGWAPDGEAALELGARLAAGSAPATPIVSPA